MRICFFRMRTTTSSATTAAPHPSGCSLRSARNRPCLSSRHPQQHQTDVWGEEELGGEASLSPCSASTQRCRTTEWATSGASHGRRRRTSRTQPKCTYFWHKCKCCTARGCKRRPPWRSSCVSCVHSLFVPCALVGPGYAINCTQAQPGHVGDCQKALLNARTPVALFKGPDVADWKKQEGSI